ncbi:MAG: hypothetical protein Roseis2KO_19560 [Roseivirga sp.]
MIVKNAFGTFKSPGIKGIVALLALLTVFVLTGLELMKSSSSASPMLNQQLELAVRGIGDQLLHLAGDDETPVPPVESLENATLRLSFKNSLGIQPDSLAALSISKIPEQLASHVMINVKEAASEEVVYAFEIDYSGEHNIPCLGRTLTAGNYRIDFQFDQPAKLASEYQLSMISVAGFALLFFAFTGLKKENDDSENDPAVGGFTIDKDKSCLCFNHKEIQLTRKELSLIIILFDNVGKLVSRDYLVEQIWSKEGVVTGRSLDMFISRLRKKLSVSSQVKITNQHGKGYMLVVE